jgi:hypothetical protein
MASATNSGVSEKQAKDRLTWCKEYLPTFLKSR